MAQKNDDRIMQLKEQIDLIDQVLKVCREKLQFLYNAENNTQSVVPHIK